MFGVWCLTICTLYDNLKKGQQKSLAQKWEPGCTLKMSNNELDPDMQCHLASRLSDFVPASAEAGQITHILTQ